MKSNINFGWDEKKDGSDKKTSVKVHYAPGGQSSFSLGNDYPDKKDQITTGKITDNRKGKLTEDEEDEETRKKKEELKKKQQLEYEEQQKAGAYKPKNNDIFGTSQQTVTSVKVSNPPGGKSNITFG